MSIDWRAQRAPKPRRPTGARRLRALWRTGRLVGATAGCYGPLRLSRALAGPQEPGRWLRQAIFRRWSRGFLGLAGIEVELLGQPPEPPFFLVANHLGYVDIPLLGAQLDDGVYVAQAGMADWPVFGSMARALDTIFVDREDPRALRQVNARVAAALDAGRSVVLFPEGTSTPGQRVERFLSPVLEPAVSAGMPVHYCSIAYRTRPGEPPAHQSVCWWGDMGFVDHVLALLAMPGFQAHLRFGEAPIIERDRKALARRLQAAVGEIFQATSEGELP